MRQFKTMVLFSVLSTAVPAALADTNSWHFDQKHSAATFHVKHMMVSDVVGTIGGVSGKATYDGKNVKDMQVEAQLDANTINTGEPNRDTHLKSGDFFDAQKYPTITFKSKKVIAEKDGTYKVLGDLTLHGVTKEVALNMEAPSPVVKDPRGAEHVGTTASTVIQRSDYGISWNKNLDQGGVVIGDPVKIELNVDLVRDKETANGGGGTK